MKNKTGWTVKVQEEKNLRIRELGEFGFNIPRFFFLEKDSPMSKIIQCIRWVKEIIKQNPSQIFNIRTYNHKPGEETLQNPHLTDISYDYLKIQILSYINKFSLMVDAETPDNGRISGNIMVTKLPLEPYLFFIDYCIKDKRAMVRDADKSFSGNYPACLEPKALDFFSLKNRTFFLRIIEDAVSFCREKKKDLILEFTKFSKKAGRNNRNLVYWEYRIVE